MQAMVDAVTGYPRPLPTLNDENREFWEACRGGVLKLQKCTQCSHVRYPINRFCPRCLSEGFEWAAMSGRATVFSYIVFHQSYHPGFKEQIPYNVALVQLEEGPRMFSNIVGVPNDQVKIGDAVQVMFDAVTPDITIPRFELRKEK